MGKMAAAIYRQQKVLSHFPVCCWIDWLLMIKNCLVGKNTSTVTPAAAIYRQQKVLSIFPCVVGLIIFFI
jgi:hypothetical protein